MLARGPVCASVAVLLLVSGCVAPGGEVEPAAGEVVASPVRFALEDLLAERLLLALDDGVKLDVAVFRPDVEKAGFPDEKVPVLADVGPYFGNLAGPMMELTGFDARLAEHFVPRGYAVARVSLRGTGMSEGCFGIGDERERKDVAQAVEFLASQPWSNGRVALIGKSYDGTTPWMAAVENPPSLRTVVPISGITDMYRYTFQDGVPYDETTAFQTYYPLLVDYDVYPSVPPSVFPGHEKANLVRTCADLVSHATDGSMGYVNGDHGTPYWRARDYEPLMGEIEVPVFLVHGLQDWNVKPDNSVPQFEKLDVPKAMWLGQWEHDYPDINRHNREWDRHDWNDTLLTWFDHWLKDVDNGWERLAHVEVQDTAGAWRTFSTWPPADADTLTLHPAPDGSLAADPAEEGALALRDPTARGHRPTEDEGTGVTFLTGELPRDVTLIGTPTLDLHVKVDQPGGRILAKLWDVAPNGTATKIAHGARSLRHAETRETGKDPTPNAPFNATVTMYAQHTLVPQGHRLALTFAVEDTGRYLRSPFPTMTTTILLGGDHATTLTLQLLNGDAPALLEAANNPSESQSSPQACHTPCLTHEIVK